MLNEDSATVLLTNEKLCEITRHTHLARRGYEGGIKTNVGKEGEGSDLQLGYGSSFIEGSL